MQRTTFSGSLDLLGRATEVLFNTNGVLTFEASPALTCQEAETLVTVLEQNASESIVGIPYPAKSEDTQDLVADLLRLNKYMREVDSLEFERLLTHARSVDIAISIVGALRATLRGEDNRWPTWLVAPSGQEGIANLLGVFPLSTLTTLEVSSLCCSAIKRLIASAGDGAESRIDESLRLQAVIDDLRAQNDKLERDLTAVRGLAQQANPGVDQIDMLDIDVQAYAGQVALKYHSQVHRLSPELSKALAETVLGQQTFQRDEKRQEGAKDAPEAPKTPRTHGAAENAPTGPSRPGNGAPEAKLADDIPFGGAEELAKQRTDLKRDTGPEPKGEDWVSPPGELFGDGVPADLIACGKTIDVILLLRDKYGVAEAKDVMIGAVLALRKSGKIACINRISGGDAGVTERVIKAGVAHDPSLWKAN